MYDCIDIFAPEGYSAQMQKSTESVWYLVSSKLSVNFASCSVKFVGLFMFEYFPRQFLFLNRAQIGNFRKQNVYVLENVQ